MATTTKQQPTLSVECRERAISALTQALRCLGEAVHALGDYSQDNNPTLARSLSSYPTVYTKNVLGTLLVMRELNDDAIKNALSTPVDDPPPTITIEPDTDDTDDD